MEQSQAASPLSKVHWQLALLSVIVSAAAWPFFDELLGRHSRKAAKVVKRNVFHRRRE